ncbi:MAG: hypothetical protein RL367_406, partial [Pseudomonadota bacterium]
MARAGLKDRAGQDRQLQLSCIPGLVSVVVPTYNRAMLVQDVLACLLAQTWPSIEIIVVDDGSTDETQAMLTRLQSAKARNPLILLYQPNAGPAAARNNGMRHARGEFFYFIDSDDLVPPHAIETLVRALQSSDRPYCLANIVIVDEQARPIQDAVRVVVKQDHGDLFSSGWAVHAALYRRTAVIAAGWFNESLRIGEDCHFRWQMITTNGDGCCIDAVIGFRRLHSFGHLSIGRSQMTGYRDSVAALSAFGEWAARNDRSSRAITIG